MKKTPFSKAQFIASAFDVKSFPKMQGQNGNCMPEIALVGRSNVGKSSLINHLLRNSNLAKTSSTPGKTQSINFFSVDDAVGLVDLPGYGYAKVKRELRGAWSKLIDEYLKTRESLRLILLLIDSRRELTEEDQALIEWAQFYNKPLLFVFTKADKKIESGLIQKKIGALKSLFHEKEIHFLSYSIKNPNARIELVKKIQGLWDF